MATDGGRHAPAGSGRIAPADVMTNSIGMKLVLVPPGEFMMGSPDDEELRGDDECQHRVRIAGPFWLGVHEVTVAQFRRFVKEAGYTTDPEKRTQVLAEQLGGSGEPAKFGVRTWREPGFSQGDDHPVVAVSWQDAVQFCAWLSRQESRTYRLPTEAEWEYACRAGTTTPFSSGSETRSLKSSANVGGASLARATTSYVCWDDGWEFTSPVGSFQPNLLGLYDMHGNVWEFCADWYDADYGRRSPKDDPRGPAAGRDRVIRGGSCLLMPAHSRSANRASFFPALEYAEVGFRVAMSAPPARPKGGE